MFRPDTGPSPRREGLRALVRDAGVKSVEGYWSLMQHLMSPEAHASFLIFNEVSVKN